MDEWALGRLLLGQRKERHGKEGEEIMGACARTGMCCERIELIHSPKSMREAFRNWRDGVPQTVKYGQIWLLYPMLAGKCLGKFVRREGTNSETVKYVYGPCKNLTLIDGVKACGIHEDRPTMCSGFPTYEEKVEIRNVQVGKLNPSQYKGCGYNEDKTIGDDLTALVLQPLEESEK
jgi:Fe-S-cluster containining protein